MRLLFRSIFSSLLILGMIIVVGCTSNTTSSTDTVVQTDQGNDPGAVNDPGTDTSTDTGTDTCTCSTKDDCCNGCHPVNNGKECGNFTLCQTMGTCHDGACQGGGEAKICDAPGQCRTGSGTCNPDTGKCEYKAGPDGQACKAKDDIDGSGLCQAGNCIGFDACDHSVYDQPANYPCNFNSECASGQCKAMDDGFTTYCTQECGTDLPDCPKNMFCMNGGLTEGRFCRPLNRDTIEPKDASQDIYAPCNTDQDCKGGMCLALDNTKFCAKNCESTDHKADDTLCGKCGTCRDNGDTLGFNFKFYCIPKGRRKSGEPCRWSGDCMHRYCMDGLCSEQCLDFGGKSNCPDNMTCLAGVLKDPSIMVCVPEGQAGKGFGETCAEDYSCKDDRKCMDIAGKKICTMDCSEDGATCVDGKCTTYASKKKACIPESWIETQGNGEPCSNSFQCKDGLRCYIGTCLKTCKTDDDCAEKVCFVDLLKQAAYCVPPCESDKDCPSNMACFQKQCVLSSNHQVYINGLCRADKDCVTGLCKGSICVDECKDDADCEGNADIQPGSLALCSPCKPDNFGTDCKDDYGFNECVRGLDGSYFCAPQCDLIGKDMCPVGTRCYTMSSGVSVCAPISGSCDMQTACNSQSLCTKPAAPSMPCTEDADCGIGKCKNGLCEGNGCDTDTDCGCSLQVCADGKCELSPDAGLVEQEPNDTPAQAQDLDKTTGTIIASLYSQDKPDKDYYRITLKAGDTMDVWTAPFCHQFADTKLTLLNSDGSPIKDWTSDSIANNYTFSLLPGFVAKTDQSIIIEVSQGKSSPGVERVNYVLGVNVFKPVANDTCDQAIPVANDQTNHYDMARANNDMAAPSCTGAAAPGKDMAFHVSVPANNYITVDAETPFDSQLYLITDCADPDKSCVAGADNYWKVAPEHLVYANYGSNDQDLTLVVDSFLPMADMGFDLSVQVLPIKAPDNNTVATATPINADKGTITGNNTGATNDYDTGKDGCVGAALPGRDVVYSLELQPNESFNLTLKTFAGAYPVFLLTKDPTDPQGCLTVAQGSLAYTNKETAVQKAFLIIDSTVKDGYSTFSMDYTLK